MTEPTCPMNVSDGTFQGHTCGRPIKDEGLCAIHLHAKNKREERAHARETRKAALIKENAEKLSIANSACSALKNIAGVEAAPLSDWKPELSMSKATGGITLSMESTIKLKAFLEALEERLDAAYKEGADFEFKAMTNQEVE